MPSLLVVNAGSSSIKFALFDALEPLVRVLSGQFARIGLPDSFLTVTSQNGTEKVSVAVPDHTACVRLLLETLQRDQAGRAIKAVGHRIVHGGPHYSQPEIVSPQMLLALQEISPFDPEHMPAEIGLIEAFSEHFPNLPQVACFDTAFHQTMPRVAQLLPLPRKYDAQGVRKYGFHGLSYAYLLEELTRVAGAEAAAGRVVLAHLGNGASLCAVRNEQSIDTTMSFTPTAGLVMSSRTGDLDPGLFAYFSRTEGMSADQFQEMVNKQSGLLGVSETSPDVRDLLAREATDHRAAEALALFCYQAKKSIAAMAATLGGLDTLVFSGGIGENSPAIRARICEGMQFLGIELDPARNIANDSVLSRPHSPVTVRMMHTDEEIQIARSVMKLVH